VPGCAERDGGRHGDGAGRQQHGRGLLRLGHAERGNQVELTVRLPSTSALNARVVLVNGSGTELIDEDGVTGDGHFLVTLSAGATFMRR